MSVAGLKPASRAPEQDHVVLWNTFAMWHHSDTLDAGSNPAKGIRITSYSCIWIKI